MSSECCWRRRPTSRVGWRWRSTAPGSSICSARRSPSPSGTRRRCCSTSSRHREEFGRRRGAGGQQPGDPGARRLRLHARVRRRTALPGQPAQPDSRRHQRHPEPRPVGPQGDSARRRQPRRARQSGSAVRWSGLARAAGWRRTSPTRWEASWQRLVAVTATMFAAGDPEAAMANSAIYSRRSGTS